MKTLSILSLLLLLTNCAGGKSVRLGERCTASDAKQLQEKSYVWFVSKEAALDFDKRINKANCLDS